MLQIVFKEYLVKLEIAERRNPEGDRRYVPTMADISRASGVSFPTINRIANGHARYLNLDTGNKIINAIRGYGFDMKAEHLIRFTPDKE